MDANMAYIEIIVSSLIRLSNKIAKSEDLRNGTRGKQISLLIAGGHHAIVWDGVAAPPFRLRGFCRTNVAVYRQTLLRYWKYQYT